MNTHKRGLAFQSGSGVKYLLVIHEHTENRNTAKHLCSFRSSSYSMSQEKLRNHVTFNMHSLWYVTLLILFLYSFERNPTKYNSQAVAMYCVAELDGCGKSSGDVGTIIQGSHGCQSWALVSEMGDVPVKVHLILSQVFFLFTVKLCTTIVYSMWACTSPVELSGESVLFIVPW